MDANSSISSKHQKHHEGEGRNIERCISLGDLPDVILQEIISSLPTKEAVQTSVLSKRWVALWMAISNIELKEGSPEKRQQFIDFVEKLLACNSSRLKKFSIAFEVGEDAPQVNRWLGGFIKPSIEELNLDFERVGQPLVLPDHLFTSETLTNFQLSMQHVMNLPSSIYFQNLKVMTLKHVIFPDGSPTQQLFSSCPSLEELTLIDCSWLKVKAVCIACPSLKTLIIREWKDDADDSVKLDQENDAGGRSVPTHCQIVITGSNLKTFSYDGDLLNDYFLFCTSWVTDATVEVYPSDSRLDSPYFVFKLLKALSNVEKLSFTDYVAEALSRTSFLIGHLSLFNKLVELRVISVSPIGFSCDALLAILRNSPILETLELVMGVSLPQSGANNIDPLPACFGTHLKTIKIYGFAGSEVELNAIKFLLQAASALDAFYIYSNGYDFDSPAGIERLNVLHQRIMQFPRASENGYICALCDFSNPEKDLLYELRE
ncbi:F-box/LRR-repeat protein At3g26922-like [Abrus precatorius]|uniref:F-box/LRR-repeat protein At3g26922-like n=1 Tax=Abrus precatorius TaxID=3816 RepID=A0A8B8M1X8_ABRPR|nr:F-box/LRR-repeat protein At3g26922-like [Abrus precatorius]